MPDWKSEANEESLREFDPPTVRKLSNALKDYIAVNEVVVGANPTRIDL